MFMSLVVYIIAAKLLSAWYVNGKQVLRIDCVVSNDVEFIYLFILFVFFYFKILLI